MEDRYKPSRKSEYPLIVRLRKPTSPENINKPLMTHVKKQISNQIKQPIQVNWRLVKATDLDQSDLRRFVAELDFRIKEMTTYRNELARHIEPIFIEIWKATEPDNQVENSSEKPQH